MGGDDEDEDPSEGGSMPGSLTKMLDSDFIRYREQMLGKPSEAEAYKQQVRRSLENDGDEGEGSGEEEDEDDDDDDDLEPEEPFSEELDFSSVPVRSDSPSPRHLACCILTWLLRAVPISASLDTFCLVQHLSLSPLFFALHVSLI